MIFAPFRLPVILEKLHQKSTRTQQNDFCQTKCDPKLAETVSCNRTLNLLARTQTEMKEKKKCHNLSNCPKIVYNVNYARQMPKIFIFY